jgi:hypothetical protein
MNKYEIKFKGKIYYRFGHNLGEALDKFLARCAFGRRIIFDVRLNQYDADTRGETWAEYTTTGDDDPHTLLISRL